MNSFRNLITLPSFNNIAFICNLLLFKVAAIFSMFCLSTKIIPIGSFQKHSLFVVHVVLFLFKVMTNSYFFSPQIVGIFASCFVVLYKPQDKYEVV